jgi:DNA-directed RNA polymerase sigma subunit (sigma70/sigma32)
MTLSEISAKLGLSVEVVRKTELKALRKVGEALQQRGYQAADFFDNPNQPQDYEQHSSRRPQ